MSNNTRMVEIKSCWACPYLFRGDDYRGYSCKLYNLVFGGNAVFTSVHEGCELPAQCEVESASFASANSRILEIAATIDDAATAYHKGDRQAPSVAELWGWSRRLRELV